jgi:hypothetical protein
MDRRAFTYRIGIAAVVAVGTLLVGADRALAQENELLGTWVLDRAASTYSGAAPEQRTMMFEKTPTGIKHTTETLQGEVRYKIEYTFNVDGKEYPADVQMATSTISVRRIDDRTLARTGNYNGMPVEQVTWKLAPDGKRLIEDRHAELNGATVDSHQEFVKQ